MTTTSESFECHACGSLLAARSTFCVPCGSPVQSRTGLMPGGSVPATGTVPLALRVDARGPGRGAIADGPLAGRVPARPGRRVAAFLIDGASAFVLVMTASTVLFGQLSSAIEGGSSSAIASTASAALFGPLVVWVLGGLLMVAVEGATGATIGNAAVGIRTVTAKTGGDPGFGRAFARRFVEQLGSLFIVGGPLIAASSAWDATPLRQGWQDKAAGTTMVHVGSQVALPGRSGASFAAVEAPVPPSPSIPGSPEHLVVPPPPTA